MLRTGLLLAVTAAALCACASPHHRRDGPPGTYAPSPARVTPPPIEVIRPRV
ncbi:MAG: hypothetical protein KKC14_15500 [Alphaproteobacteria bacterium]|nr:hypothetical protein [Alphaproteobacteria bacterium]